MRIFWLDASDSLRRQVSVVGGVLLLGFIALTYYLVLYTPDIRPSLPPEPTTLARKKLRYSFGLGEGVDYPHRNDKLFEFEFNAATRAMILLHYHSRDISVGEVDVAVNGTSVDKLAADTEGSDEKMNTLFVNPSLVKRGEKNTLVFDNVKNPPGRDPWRIWNVWVETVLLPDMPPDQLVREAREAYRRGQEAFERRDVGADSRYRSWLAFRQAWLMLEAHPDPKPQLYQLAKERLRESQNELDRMCRKLLLEVEQNYHQKDFAAARHTLDFVTSYFTGDDQPCPSLADEKRQQYRL